MLNYELLRTFVIAATARTFGEAAAERRVTVSAISQQVKTLEAQLGIPLFERLGRRVRITEEGRALLDALRPALEQVEEALAAAVSAHGAVRGRIAIGAPRPFARHWLRPRLPRLLAAHPDLRVELTFDVPSVLERNLAAGDLDLIVLARAPELPGIASEPLATETFVAVASPAYLAVHGRPVTADGYRAQRWIVFDRDLAMHAPWWRATFGRRAPLPERIACTVASLDEMLALAEAGVGLAVLPDYHVAAALAARRLVLVPGARSPARNQLLLGWRRGAVESARLRAVRDALRAP
jgi:DNA-binding transcriptional LysR family regulator